MPQTRQQARLEANSNKAQTNIDVTLPEAGNGSFDKSSSRQNNGLQEAGREAVAMKVNPKISTLLSSPYAVPPLNDIGLKDPESPTAETMLAHLYNTILSSTRISHSIAHETLKCLVEEGYHNLKTLNKSTWQQRTEVLTRGGYTHYREKTATFLGELGDYIRDELDGDLNNLISDSGSSPAKIRSTLKSIKGLGEVGVNIFFDTAQGLWTCLSPFIDPRSTKTAEQIGLGGDVDRLWEDVDRDPQKMCKLATALTTIRLEKKEKEFSK